MKEKLANLVLDESPEGEKQLIDDAYLLQMSLFFMFRQYYQISRRLAGIVFIYSTRKETQSQKRNMLDYSVPGRIIML